MSDLRNQLESAKAEYDALKYPGHLMDDVNATRPIRVDRSAWISGRLRWVGGIAAAAAVAIVVFVQSPVTPQPTGDTAQPSASGPVWIGQTPPVIDGTNTFTPGGNTTMVGFNGPATQPAAKPDPTTMPR